MEETFSRLHRKRAAGLTSLRDESRNARWSVGARGATKGGVVRRLCAGALGCGAQLCGQNVIVFIVEV